MYGVLIFAIVIVSALTKSINVHDKVRLAVNRNVAKALSMIKPLVHNV